MTLHEMLTIDFADAHSAEAAAVLERCQPQEIAEVFKALPLKTAAVLGAQMAPLAVARACERCEAELAAGILSHMSVVAALPVLRRVTPAYSTAILDALPAKHRDSLRGALGFAPGSAGSLMDPSLLAFTLDMTAAAALETVKKDAALIHYNLYVVDRNHVLVGALNLQELLLADANAKLENIMKRPVHSLDAGASRHEVSRHPGWRQVYSLPVVDSDGRFIGAVRYRALRQLETELEGDQTTSEDLTIRALGDLFGAGMIGFVTALAAGVSLPKEKSAGPGQGDPTEE